MKTSLLQHQKSGRIKTEPTRELDEFMLSNLHDIQQKFDEFCDEQAKEWVQLERKDDGPSPLRHHGSMISPLIQLESRKFIKPLKQEELFQKEKVNFFVERYFNKLKPIQRKAIQSDQSNDNLHFLIRQQSDNSLINALIVETYNQYSSNQPIDTVGTAQKILKAFNISPLILSSKTTSKERQEYIVKQFQDTVDTLMKEWRVKLVQKQRKLKQQDEQFRKSLLKTKESKEDIFGWLQLRTKYEVLQKKLKEMIMERLNDYENQLKLIKGMKTGLMVELEGIPRMKTSEIVSRTDPKAGSLLKSLKYAKPQTIELQEQSKYDEQDFIWNGVLERKFLSQRTKGKEKYFPVVSASNFNHLAYMTLFNEVSPEDPSHLQRDLKMAKYQNGDWLTAQELEFLANSSRLLNSCVDQKLLKKLVGMIKPKQIQHLETNLAEQIIENYDRMTKKIQKSRTAWLRKHITNTKKSIVEVDKQNEKLAQYAINRKTNEKQKKRLEVICKKLSANISIKDQVQQNFYAQIFVKVVMHRIGLIRERKEEINKKYNEEYEKEQEKKRLFKEKIKTLSRPNNVYEKPTRKHHPSSKLSLFEKSEHNVDSVEGQNFQRRLKYMGEKVKEYRLSIMEAKTNDKDNFAKFYSNGPNQAVREEPIFDPMDPDKEPKLNAKELKSIILIQKCYKKYISEKKMRNFKEYYYNKKYKSYYQNLERMVFAKKFNSFIKNSLKRNKSFEQADEATRIKTVESKQTMSNKNMDTSRKSGFLFSPQSQFAKPPQTKLIKHLRLLRYAKLNLLAGVQKGGFVYSKEDVNVKDEDGICALYYVSENGNIQFVEYLIQLGADPNLRCLNGDTPFHMAFKSDNLHIIMMMLGNGGDLNRLNDANQTPLIYGKISMLKKLGLLEAICTAEAGSKFDNNALLHKQKHNDLNLY